MLEGMIADTIGITGYNGEVIHAYYAQPLTGGPVPSVVVLHHMPGWDEWTKEVVRKFAFHGYAAIAPHLFHRFGPGRWDDVTAAARAKGGASDAQVIGDTEGAMAFLRAQPQSNGKVGVIGFCSGGRQAYLAACKIPSLDAAVDCWGGRVVATPDQLTPRTPVAPIDYTVEMGVPLLGLFGADDVSPSPADVATTEEALKKHSKTYEFHVYEGAGHGFFAT